LADKKHLVERACGVPEKPGSLGLKRQLSQFVDEYPPISRTFPLKLG